jgi:phosphatidylinositol alpha-1,6-mannosyltransferase
VTKTTPNVAILTCEYPPFPGGIGTYAAGIEGALNEDGVTTIVAAPIYPTLPSPTDTENTLRIFKHHRISPAAAWKAASIIRQLPKNGVVLAADLRTVVLTYLITRLVRRKYIAMVHGSEASKFRANSVAFRLARQAYLNAAFVAYNSYATRQIFEDGIGRPQAGGVTHLGVEGRWFLPPTTNRFENLQIASVDEEVPIICSVGRVEARKGQTSTIQAIALAQSQFGLNRCVYVIAGKVEEPQYAGMILYEARKAGVEVIMAGRLSEDDLKLLYVRSACHSLLAEALPGKIEGFGLVLLEAAAQGCPSVATNIGGIPEVLGDTGVVVEANDLHNAARAFANFAQSRDSRTSSGKAAQLRANEFTWRKCAEKTFQAQYLFAD